MNIAQLLAQAKMGQAGQMPGMNTRQPPPQMPPPQEMPVQPAGQVEQVLSQETMQEPINMDEYVPEIKQLLEAGYHPAAIAQMIHEASDDPEHPFRSALGAVRQLSMMGGELQDGN